MRTNETIAPITFPRRPPENALREMIRVFGLVEKVMQPYFARFGISGAQSRPCASTGMMMSAWMPLSAM